jgi:hypothetical protein
MDIVVLHRLGGDDLLCFDRARIFVLRLGAALPEGGRA